MTRRAKMKERVAEAAVEYVLLQNDNRPMTVEEIRAAIRALEDLDFARIRRMATSAT